MPAIAAMVIKDGKPAPLDHTFSPVRVDASAVAKLVDRSGGIAAGFPVITLQLREPVGNNSKSRIYKATVKVFVPVLEVSAPSTASGFQPAPTVAYTQASTHEFLIPERSTPADRADIYAYSKNLLAHAVVASMILNLEPVYG